MSFTRLVPSAIALAFVLLANRSAAADPDRRWYLAGNAPLKWDGHNGSRTDSNPLTNRLYYAPLSIELGYRFTSTLGVHATLGLGPIVGAETSGLVGEALVGLDALIPLGERFRLGVRIDAGYTSLDYTFQQDATTISRSALVLEPKAAAEVDLDRDWTLGLYLGPRWKWTRGAPEHGRQTGWSAAVSLMRRF